MNPDQIKQVVESLKTLNININDATTQKIADAIIPVVKMYIIKDYVSMFLTSLTFMAIILVPVYLWYKWNKKEQEREDKRNNY